MRLIAAAFSGVSHALKLGFEKGGEKRIHLEQTCSRQLNTARISVNGAQFVLLIL
jgi:hypothetical protein